MKKALAILLTAFLFVSLFISCGPEPKVELTIKFDGNGEDVEGEMDDLKVYKGEEVTLPHHAFIKDEYYFTGWNTEKDGKGDWYYEADTVSFDKDTTLYAQWFKEVVTVKFNSNGGKGLMAPQWVKKGEATALRPNTYKYDGHLFLEWNNKKDGTGEGHYPNKAEITTDKDIILYAQWVNDLVTMDDRIHWNEKDGKVYSLSQNLKIEGRVIVDGAVTLNLPEGITLTVTEGITVNEGNSLTIEGSGKLDIPGAPFGHAGIGGQDEKNCGKITINGGMINAISGSNGAGIGGGRHRDGGIITINGGTIVAKSYYLGAGIGGGHEGGGGNIEINGGDITATGGHSGGAGIGGGIEGAGGTVVISDGKVVANGTLRSAGIGGGGGDKGSGANITIRGGVVIATGGDPAYPDEEIPDGMGKGFENKEKGTLTLEGVTIEVSDDGNTWSPFEKDERHRYMRTKN